MKKSILVLCMVLLMGCDYDINIHKRTNAEIKCKDHEGIDYYTMNALGRLRVTCLDGTELCCLHNREAK